MGIFVHQQCMANSGIGKMHLDLYTQNAGLTHKAKFWCNYVSALKGSQDLRAPDQTIFRTIHPSIVETLPDTFPELKHEFSKRITDVRQTKKTRSNSLDPSSS